MASKTYEERKAYYQARYLAQKDKLTEQSKAWKAANRDTVNAIARKSYRTRKDAGALPADDKREYLRTYYANNTERLQAYQAAYRAEHREEKRAYDKKYVQNNPDVVYAHVTRRRARKKNAAVSDLTADQRRTLIDSAHGVCAYCRYYTPGCHLCAKGTHVLTIDHIQPLKHGGSHTLSNLVACCRSCNSKKNAGPLPGPVQPLLL